MLTQQNHILLLCHLQSSIFAFSLNVFQPAVKEYGPFALASTDEVTSAATSLQKREVASMQEVLTKSSALHLRTSGTKGESKWKGNG